VPGRLELGEGPRWVDGRLVFVNILAGTLYAADTGAPGAATVLASTAPLPLGAVAPLESEPGSWVAAVGTGVAILRPGQEPTWLGKPADGGTPRRMNDGVCDPRGRFWATCMGWGAEPGAGSVFLVDQDGTISTQLDGLTVPNGPAFTPDGTVMYLADSARRLVFRHELDAEGRLGPGDVLIELTDGSPDGMTVDTNGDLWVAVWGAGQVRRFDARGRLRGVVDVPAPQPTAPCLVEGRLFVTTAARGLTGDDGSASGAVFVADVGASAPPAAAYVMRGR
jgi:sugar lactone lactonase YvrE